MTTNWREHDEDEELAEEIMRDRSTRLERMWGWILSYPVRVMIIALIVVIVLTLFCGL